jgi:hypothetical protein
VRRFETILLGIFLGAWLVVLLNWLRLVSLSGNLPLGSLYPLYSFACFLGWSAGTLYVLRRRGSPPGRGRTPLLVLYYLGPYVLIYLLWAMTPVSFQRAAWMAPVYAFGVLTIFFFVPVKLLRLAR